MPPGLRVGEVDFDRLASMFEQDKISLIMLLADSIIAYEDDGETIIQQELIDKGYRIRNMREFCHAYVHDKIMEGHLKSKSNLENLVYK